MTVKKSEIVRGLVIRPDDVGMDSIEGELKVGATTKKIHSYLDGAVRNVVTENQTGTLTNKTIDADTNTISNLEVDNLKSGVLDTDLATTSAADDTIPSAKAVKSYVDASAASGSSALAAETTARQNADAALQVEVDAVESALATHIADTTDAHDASAISVVPAGNLASTDVQSALVEHQGDIDTNTAAIAGKVTGPASSVDNTLVRFDGTTGKLIQGSIPTLSDTGAIDGLTGLISSGQITSTGALRATKEYWEDQQTNSTTTGANATLPNPTTPIVRLTNSGLTSIDMIADDSFVGGRTLTLYNHTGNSITINNNTGATANRRFLTGTKAPITIADEASILIKYDEIEQRWMVIGGSGSGSATSFDTIAQLNGTDLSTFVTGNNASFLGGGTIAGTFAANTTTPLQGISSYQYTQAAGSLNDYVSSAVLPVDLRFRGRKAVVALPYTYDGGSSDIQIIVYCATTLAILTPNALLPTSTANGIFQTTIDVPLTCTGIRFGHQTKIANSGKIFKYDSVQLTNNLQYVPQPTSQSSTLNSTTAFNNTNFSGAVSTSDGSGIYSYNSTTGVYTVLKNCNLELSGSISTATTTSIAIVISLSNQAAAIGHTPSATGTWASASIVAQAKPGDTFSFANGTTAASLNARAYVLATATADQILTAPDTFSTDTAALVYASSAAYNFTTLANAPVGTFITFTYAANTNTRTQTTTAPTQTTADMNSNGILLQSREAFTNASLSTLPSSIAIQIGKGQKGLSKNLYQNVGKVGSVDSDFYIPSSTSQRGLRSFAYNEQTGILYMDAGFLENGTVTSNRFFSTEAITTVGPAYLTISASKNPALTGLNISAVAARGVNTSGTTFPNAVVTTLTYDSAKSFDTHGGLNTSTGVFTAPEAGYYQYSAQILTSNLTFAAGNTIELLGFKNGVRVADNRTIIQTAITNFFPVILADTVFLAKGETLDIRIYQDRGAPITLFNLSGFNYFSISKTSVG